jgi:hypothetical protein
MASRIRLRQRINPDLRWVTYSAVLFFLLAGGFFLISNLGPSHNAHAGLGLHGARTVTTANTILNEYTTLTNNASAGATSIKVASSSLNANGRFSAALEPGDLIMIVQMQGASISTSDVSTYGQISSYNNCGNFEFVQVASVPSSTQINLSNGLARSYSRSGNVQVVRVPRYSSFTVNAGASVTCPAWNGSTGGIVAIESNGATVINGTIDVSGKGFRGGTTEQNTSTPGNSTIWRSTLDTDGAEKGESIAGPASVLANGRYGRGAPANGGGGGNSHNGGGGGGANGGNTATWNGKGNPHNLNANWIAAWNLEAAGFAGNTSSGGGRGGYSWSSNFNNPITTAPGNAAWGGDNRKNVGGYGGRPLTYAAGKIFLGGGGGAGDSNNGVGTPGGAGGGIVYLLSGGAVSGSGTINADGEDVPTSTGAPGDAGGGGGGGGTIFIYTNGASVGGLTLNARGGEGGSQNLNNGGEVEGNGGGGGGGYISTTNPAGSLVRNVSGGSYGTTTAPPMVNFTANGATSGGVGTIVTNPANPYTTPTALPIELKSFYAKPEKEGGVTLNWVTASEINNDYFTLERSADGLHYTVINKQPGAGNSTTQRFYGYTDTEPEAGDNFYRLTQTDYDGKSETFDPVHMYIDRKGATGAAIANAYPNPFSDRFEVNLKGTLESRCELTLVNSGGVTIRSIPLGPEDISRTQVFDNLEGLPGGLYMLYLTDAEGKNASMVKLVKR